MVIATNVVNLSTGELQILSPCVGGSLIPRLISSWVVNLLCTGRIMIGAGLDMVYWGISNTLFASLDAHDSFTLHLHLCPSDLPLYLGVRISLNISSLASANSAHSTEARLHTWPMTQLWRRDFPYTLPQGMDKLRVRVRVRVRVDSSSSCPGAHCKEQSC